MSALLVPVIAVLGAYLAYRQWRLAQNKFKLDLFDRRLRIYEAARDLLASIMSSGKADDQKMFTILVVGREANWLLNDSIAEYFVKEIYRKAVDLQMYDAELPGATGEDRTSNIRKQRELKEWFMAQYKVLNEKFTPFLKLEH